MRYEISNQSSGQSLGVYEGDSPEAAYDAMARDAGYRDAGAMRRASGNQEMQVVEVDSDNITESQLVAVVGQNIVDQLQRTNAEYSHRHEGSGHWWTASVTTDDYVVTAHYWQSEEDSEADDNDIVGVDVIHHYALVEL